MRRLLAIVAILLSTCILSWCKDKDAENIHNNEIPEVDNIFPEMENAIPNDSDVIINPDDTIEEL